MLWWLIALSVLVLYLLYRVYQIISWLERFYSWLQMYYNAINKHFVDCGCPGGEDWPPDQPPTFP